MKTAFNIILDLIAGVAHIFLRYRTLCLWKSLKRNLYSKWIQREFVHCGKGCKFDVFDMLTGAHKMSFGDNVIVGAHSVLELYDEYGDNHFDAHLTVGNNTKIGPYNHISCVNNIQIGNDVLFGRRVFITDNSHGQALRSQLDMNPDLRPVHSKGAVRIEDCAWIGEGVSIMPGVTIGRGSIIGANAVVTKDIPAYCIAAGVPATIIKNLN